MVVAWSSVKTLAMIRNVWRADVAIQGALHPTDAFARRVPVKGIPNSEGLPLIEGTPVPVVEHGGVLVERGAVGLEGGAHNEGGQRHKIRERIRGQSDGWGLRPPTAISVEPNGMPTRPTDDVEYMVKPPCSVAHASTRSDR